ncbi:inositol monophosphatase family protein [Aquipuribacter sp. SD81]|uniref:inositol monophosphatase family protein n=1 Tax=Aquipuribacter sp. SD81 TaxID=3127703 RepID=UPI003017D50A
MPDGAEPAPEELRALARELARRTGHLLTEHRRAVADDVTVARTKSSGTDVVTAADEAAERLLRDLLAEHRPDDGVLGEEEGVTAGTSGLTWVLDPLDGTVNYLYGLPAYAVSVAVARGDDPASWTVLAGAVHDAAHGGTFSAALGGGADLDGQPLRVSGCTRLEQCLLSTGFSYRSEVRAEQGALLAHLLPRVRDVRRGGSAALDLCAVAAGRLDAHMERGLNPWDHAAAGLVVTEAGGLVHGPDGGPASDALVVAGSPGVVPALERLLAEAAAATGARAAGSVGA